jgi:hypothetical protein|tara:strand:+ start:185 stop:442 length:258 start_codon:yes stop_codon:yes gene_type:complete
MDKFKINNSKDLALWQKIPCTCNKGSVIKEHPIQPCEFCRCEIAWKSVPQRSFIVKDQKGKDKTINEISLKRGKHEDIQGWSWSW